MKAANPDLVQVILIDDDDLFGRSLKRLLEAHGYSASVYASLNQLTDAGPVPQIGCAILDLDLPGSNGLDIQAHLRLIAPALSIVFLTGFGKVTASVRAMKAGAVDFLEKPVEEAVLLATVITSIERSRRLRAELSGQEQLRIRFERLTVREREVFMLITSGLLNKQAAAELGLAEKTIKVHRARVMGKMGAGSLAELAKAAHRLGLDSQALPRLSTSNGTPKSSA